VSVCVSSSEAKRPACSTGWYQWGTCALQVPPGVAASWFVREVDSAQHGLMLMGSESVPACRYSPHLTEADSLGENEVLQGARTAPCDSLATTLGGLPISG
jgi:hypothetical protein